MKKVLLFVSLVQVAAIAGGDPLVLRRQALSNAIDATNALHHRVKDNCAALIPAINRFNLDNNAVDAAVVTAKANVASAQTAYKAAVDARVALLSNIGADQAKIAAARAQLGKEVSAQVAATKKLLADAITKQAADTKKLQADEASAKALGSQIDKYLSDPDSDLPNGYKSLAEAFAALDALHVAVHADKATGKADDELIVKLHADLAHPAGDAALVKQINELTVELQGLTAKVTSVNNNLLVAIRTLRNAQTVLANMVHEQSLVPDLSIPDECKS